MWGDGKTWKQHLEKAASYIDIGDTDIYLSSHDADFPWEYVKTAEPGGTHRLDISTSVRFKAEHESGLSFTWSIDIEERDANGKGYYEIKTALLSEIMQRLPTKAMSSFKKYLRSCEVGVRASGEKYMEIAQREFGTATALSKLIEAVD